jgi:hypothetical protein
MPVEVMGPTDKLDRRAQRLGLAMMDYRFHASRWFGQFPGSPAQRQEQVRRLVLAAAPHEAPAVTDEAGFLNALVLDPVYQLK